MMEPLAIATVSVALRSLLENGIVEHSISGYIGGDAIVTVQPPQRIRTGSDERAQLNLFMYQASQRGLTPISRFQGAESSEIPARRTTQRTLEMNYVVSVYGAQDLQMELLLGCAQHVLHSHATLTTEILTRTLTAAASVAGGMASPVTAALAQSDSAKGIKCVQLTQQILPLADSHSLWAMLQAPFRPCLLYKATATLTPPTQLAASLSGTEEAA